MFRFTTITASLLLAGPVSAETLNPNANAQTSLAQASPDITVGIWVNLTND